MFVGVSQKIRKRLFQQVQLQFFYRTILYGATTQGVQINIDNCSVKGSIAMALIALYGLLSAPISLMGRSWTSLNPTSATQSINSRNAATSPMPKSFSRRKANSGTRTPAIRLSGERFTAE